MNSGSVAVTNAEKFQTLFNSTPDIVIYQDKNSKIQDANLAFLKLVCEPQENVIGKSFYHFLPNKLHSLFEEKLKEAMLGRIVRFEIHFENKKNVTKYWDVIKVPIIKDEKVLGVYMISRDVTEKVEANEIILNQNKDFQQFNYLIIHNLRGPLANALGMIDLLAISDINTSVFEESFVHLKTSLQQLEQVMGEIITILSNRNKEVPVEYEWLSIKNILDQVLESMEEEIGKVNGIVKKSIPKDFMVFANRSRLSRVFYNLISNSIKYRDQVRPLCIEIKATITDDQRKVITVSDNGLGIDLEKAGKNIFKLYKRFHLHIPGRGLGLYMVRSDIETMNGHIEVSSKPGHGTKFTIELS